MTSTSRILAVVFAVGFGSAVSGTALAEADHNEIHENGHEEAEAYTEDAAVQGYKEAMERMHAEMMELEYTSDADADFARAMIPHHQAAIDKAEVLLEHGEDPEMLQLAQEIIEAQEREIEQLEEWLAEHDPN